AGRAGAAAGEPGRDEHGAGRGCRPGTHGPRAGAGAAGHAAGGGGPVSGARAFAGHVMAGAALDGHALPLGDDGVIVGVDPGGRPAVLGLHHPLPHEIVLIGGVWTAQVLALRAVGTGVRVAVETARPRLWTQVAEAVAAGQPGEDRLTLHEV